LHEIIFKHKEVFRVTSAYLVFFFTMFSTQLSRDPARNIKKKKKKRDLEKKKKKKKYHQKVPLPRRNAPFCGECTILRLPSSLGWEVARLGTAKIARCTDRRADLR
jgi:hypothetical protein